MKIITAMLFLLICTTATAEVKTAKQICQDPSKLPPKERKAYYQLKEAAKEIEGMAVHIRCYKRTGYLTKIVKVSE